MYCPRFVGLMCVENAKEPEVVTRMCRSSQP